MMQDPPPPREYPAGGWFTTKLRRNLTIHLDADVMKVTGATFDLDADVAVGLWHVGPPRWVFTSVLSFYAATDTHLPPAFSAAAEPEA